MKTIAIIISAVIIFAVFLPFLCPASAADMEYMEEESTSHVNTKNGGVWTSNVPGSSGQVMVHWNLLPIYPQYPGARGFKIKITDSYGLHEITCQTDMGSVGPYTSITLLELIPIY